MRSFFLCAFCVLWVGCVGDEPTQIVVSIDTDFAVPAELSAIQITVRKAGSKEAPSYDERLELAVADRARLPWTLALTSDDGKATRVAVKLVGYGPGGKIPLVTREASARFVRGKRLVLPMNLVRGCVNVTCVAGQTCGDDGSCEPIERPDLSEWTGTPPELGTPGEGNVTPDAGMDASEDHEHSDASSHDGSAMPTDHDGGLREVDASQHDAGEVEADAGMEPVPDMNAIQGIALGFSHSCVWTYGHEAYCWGDNSHGQQGGSRPTGCPDDGECVFEPLKVSELGPIAQLAAGDGFTCALITDGKVYCFGNDDSGQLGNGEGPAGAPSEVLWDTGFGTTPLTGITRIVAGEDWACAQESPSGGVWCWGSNRLSALGIQGSEQSQLAVHASVKAVSSQRLFGGQYNACALQTSGELSCWGANVRGALQGDPETFEQSATPISMIAEDVASASAGGEHICAIVSGDVKCWGGATADQLGITDFDVLMECGVRPCSLVPVRAKLQPQALAVTAGTFNTCALVTGGRVFCWGQSEGGIIANAQAGSPTQPKPIVTMEVQPNDQPDLPLADVRLVPELFYEHICVVRGQREVLCWGWQSRGEVGPIMFPGPVWRPQVVTLPAP